MTDDEQRPDDTPGLVARLRGWSEHYANHAEQAKDGCYEKGKADGYKFAAHIAAPYEAELLRLRARVAELEAVPTDSIVGSLRAKASQCATDVNSGYDAMMTWSDAADLAAPIEAGYRARIAALETDLENSRAHTKALVRDRNGEVWYWQGDGEDHLESLTCPVLIEAADLREIVAERARLEARIAEARWQGQAEMSEGLRIGIMEARQGVMPDWVYEVRRDKQALADLRAGIETLKANICFNDVRDQWEVTSRLTALLSETTPEETRP